MTRPRKPKHSTCYYYLLLIAVACISIAGLVGIHDIHEAYLRLPARVEEPKPAHKPKLTEADRLNKLELAKHMDKGCFPTVDSDGQHTFCGSK